MKAFKVKKYGSPLDALQQVELDRPQPKDNDILIQVCATTVNDYDWSVTSGNPLTYRLLFGLSKPRKKYAIPGMELSGIVTGLGKNVTRFKIGDEVYGDTSDFGFGSFAEYISLNEKAVELKPKEISFEEAASIPHAAMLALQGLRDLGQLKDNQKILVNGGGGGVGTFAIQIAKTFNTHVTGVDTGEKLSTMKTLGFDEVVDYKKVDFTKEKQKYDLILDCKTNRNIWRFLPVLNPKGKYISIGGKSGKLLQMIYMKPLLKILSTKRVQVLMLKGNHDLEFINQLYAEKKLKCIIDGPHSFDKIPWAVQRFGEGLHTGKIVISLNQKD
ncbi:NAD(P)-dependent alcohol dehydrogenase [Brumimicrobium aurantiacum]|uniref:NAD(P)-dependent alcohol dehydrogenase n=1 Tax=Brumimicrobium aurantiacum TaxID=1737063 RepID=A0A3E1EWB4_9FLAO|nr:NAD(P)-dependent alcohol dehydrogenase [Brumimicrobium aurantiacum]RFC53837.1 NAD(P)-dependent alcohol dehydrogenase [Brumimicrobium aurantiacum]